MSGQQRTTQRIAESPDLLSLYRQLDKIFGSTKEKSELIPEFLLLAVQLVNAGAAAFHTQHGEKLLAEKNLISKQAGTWHIDLKNELKLGSAKATSTGEVVIGYLPDVPEARIISVPILGDRNSPVQGFSVALLVADQPIDLFVLVLQFMAGCYSLWLQNYQYRQKLIYQPLNSFSLLIAQLLSNGDKQYALTMLADECKTFFSADIAVLANYEPQNKRPELIYSFLTGVDSQAQQLHTVRQVIDECLLHGKILNWPAEIIGKEEGITSFILKEMVTEMRGKAAVCLPILSTNKDVAGFLVLCWPEMPDNLNHLLKQFYGESPLIAGLLHWAHKPKRLKAIQDRLKRGRNKFITLLACCTLAIGTFLVPVPFTIKGNCDLAPLEVRYVGAQFDAILKQINVQPGEKVAAGAELARLDEKEIEFDIRSLEAEIQKARKIEDVNIAAGEAARAQMALLERQGLEQKRLLFQNHLDKLAITSPIEGIVISKNLDQIKGGPVGRGQKLFEIAPLGVLIAEAQISQEDYSYLEDGAQVRINLDSFPGRLFISTVSLIYPRSEIRQSRSVFLVEAKLTNEKEELRPGMRGQMSIAAGKKPLGYRFLRTPWLYLQKFWYGI